MNKRILSMALALLMCFSVLTLTAAADADPTVSANYSSGVVSVSGSDFTANTSYIVRIVNHSTSVLTAMTQTTAGTDGAITVAVTTGTLATLSNYTVYVNSLDGAKVAKVDSISGTPATTYTITATAGTGGSISPNGDVSVTAGGSQTFTITANSGYTISDVKVDGASIGVKSSYTFSNVNADHTICATFKSRSSSGGSSGGGGGGTSRYTLTFQTNGGSAISSISKAYGTTIDLTDYKPTRSGYDFAGWYSNSALTKAVTSVKLTSSTTVYARWTKKSANPFTDVSSNYWAYDQILWAYQNSYMTGKTATTFVPAGTVTRQQLWMVLGRIRKANPANMSAAKSWAIANDISDGSNPTAAVTRQQMVTILYRYAQKFCGLKAKNAGSTGLSGYVDAGSIASYAYDAMHWAVVTGGILKGNGNKLSPTGNTTRAQFAVILNRFCKNVK